MMFFLHAIITQVIYVRIGYAFKSITISPSRNLDWSNSTTARTEHFNPQQNRRSDLRESSTGYGEFTRAPNKQLVSPSSRKESTENTTIHTEYITHPTQHIMSSLLNSSVITTICSQCSSKSNTSDDNYFSWIMLGTGIGSAFFIFAMVLLVVIVKKLQDKRQSQVASSVGSVRGNDDDVMESKESIFTSSTLQLHGGLNNDGLELETFQSPTISTEVPKSGSVSHSCSPGVFSPYHTNEGTNNTAVSSSQSTALDDLENELEFCASIKLLQDWNGVLEDHNSDQFKELKLEVEQCVKDIHRGRNEFRGVNVLSFRKGSIITDMVLVMIAAVKDPFHNLEKSVSTGQLGRLVVDCSYFVKGKGKNGFAESNVDENERLYFRVGAKEEVVEDYQVMKEEIELNESNTERSCDYEIFSNDSSTQNESLHSRTDVTDTGQATALASNGLFNEKNGVLEKEIKSKRHQHSPADLRIINSPINFREQRDSGIGSMQELSTSENRLNRTSEKSEENVFCSIPESLDTSFNESEAEYLGSSKILDQIDEDVPHVALYSFKAENDYELSIKQGDVVTVISRSLEGWLKVVNEEERVGWVPQSFLVHVSRSQLSDTQQTVETLKFFDNILDQLDAESGSGSSAASTPDEDENEDSSKGYATAPEREFEDVNLSDNKLEKKLEIQVKRCKSVYRFDGKDSSELSFQVGEIIEVHKISEVGWWKGHLDGKCGWFPSSYVMPLNEESEVAITPKRLPVFDHYISERFRQSDRALCLRSESDIRGRRESGRKRRQHKYQSLQRTARKKEEYAHLYFQILRQESKSDENIPSLYKSASLNVISNIKALAPDWPNRAPPAPPNDEMMNRSIEQHTSSYSEPPKRPVPNPPSAKPSFTKIDVVKRMAASDRILMDNIVTDKIAPPSRTKHENLLSTQAK